MTTGANGLRFPSHPGVVLVYLVDDNPQDVVVEEGPEEFLLLRFRGTGSGRSQTRVTGVKFV